MLNLDTTYKNKKNSGILKVKPLYTSDLRVIGFKLGKPQGKYSQTLGTITVDYKGYELGISGMPDDVREEVWNNQEKYLGKILEVEHQQETTNKQGGLSLEYAQFERWRFDKDEPSYAHE
jgi:DNA ligase-1